MGTELDRSRLEAWLRLAASRLHEQRDALIALDQQIGDGDHGINMDRGFTAIVAKVRTGGGLSLWHPALQWSGKPKAGAARGIRTPDPIITNDVLYQLSYCGGFRGS